MRMINHFSQQLEFHTSVSRNKENKKAKPNFVLIKKGLRYHKG